MFLLEGFLYSRLEIFYFALRILFKSIVAWILQLVGYETTKAFFHLGEMVLEKQLQKKTNTKSANKEHVRFDQSLANCA
jgi:hypothetical protein